MFLYLSYKNTDTMKTVKEKIDRRVKTMEERYLIKDRQHKKECLIRNGKLIWI